MPRLSEVTDVPDALLREAVAWYEKAAQRLPPAWGHLDPRIIRTALRLADSDPRRVVLSDDKAALIVYHDVRWSR